MEKTNPTKFGPITFATTMGATLLQPAIDTGQAGMNTPSSQAPTQATRAASDPSRFVDERLLDAKLEAVEARTDSKFAQLLGEIRVIGERLTSLDGKIAPLDGKLDTVSTNAQVGKREIIIAIITTGLAVIALAWAGVQIFQGGLGLSLGAFEAGQSTQLETANAQSETSNRTE